MYSVQEIQSLREERVELSKKAEKLLEKEKFSSEDEQNWTEIMADIDAKGKRIEKLEQMNQLQSDFKQVIEHKAGREDISVDQAEADSHRKEAAFNNFLLLGKPDMSLEDKEVLRPYSTDATGKIKMAQSVGTDSAGGYTVPDDISFMSSLRQALLAFGGMRSVSTVITTATGADLPIPTSNDTSNAGEIIAENSAVNAQDLTFAQVVLQSYKYSSKMVRVSVELLQDSAVDVPGIIGGALGERIGRITNTHFTTGTGTGQPNGIVTASTLGKTAAANNAITYDELLDLIHSVDPAYRAQGARFMFNDSTLLEFKKLKDSQNRPLWIPSYTAGAPDMIGGYPYTVNQDMASIATVAKSVLFGALQNYWIRDVRGITLLRLVERYAENHQVAFLAFARFDGDMVNAGTNPVKHLVHPV